MVERVSSLPKYYVCIRRACHCKSKADLSLYISIKQFYNSRSVTYCPFKIYSTIKLLSCKTIKSKF